MCSQTNSESGALSTIGTGSEDRVITLRGDLPAVPERLLLAHARGEVLFICGAGISRPAGLPDFRELVLEVYRVLDAAVYEALSGIPRGACNQWDVDRSNLTDRQAAEVKRFIAGDYDVVLGMLERRLDDQTKGDSSMRREVAKRLRSGANKPAATHRALMLLADRGGVAAIVTTNFDLLLEAAAKRAGSQLQTYSLSSIPRPTLQTDFSGVLHIHGALEANPARLSELILSDQDFGEFYLRRRVVPDFIYDAARLFHLVPRHRGFDWLIFGHFRMGRCSGATSSSMLRATPGWRRIRPARSRVRTI